MSFLEFPRTKLRNAITPWLVRKSIDTPGTIGIQTLISILGDEPTIFEIGAHIGTETQKFAYAFPNGRIHAFEPCPVLYRKVRENTSRYSNVTTIPVALSNQRGFSIFRQSSGTSNGSGSLLEPTLHLTRHPTVQFLEIDQFIVPTALLDDYFKIAGIDHVDLIWIDAQGAEGMVFEGASESLKHCKYVYCEVSVVPEYQGGAAYSDIKSILANHGLRPIKEFMPTSWDGSGNVLFGRQDFFLENSSDTRHQNSVNT
jgi:FkbM family methyltransferase